MNTQNEHSENAKDARAADKIMRAKFIPWGAKVAKVTGWIAYDIVWDTVCQPIDLPTSVVIKDGNLEFDDVAKHLSQEYGCGVYSLGIRPLTKGRIVSFPAEYPK